MGMIGSDTLSLLVEERTYPSCHAGSSLSSILALDINSSRGVPAHSFICLKSMTLIAIALVDLVCSCYNLLGST